MRYLDSPSIPLQDIPFSGQYTLPIFGNPGRGKSTILNTIAKMQLFESGSSVAGGLTTNIETVQLPAGMTLMDTPGLADIFTAANAAHAVEDGLKKNTVYKLLFTIKLVNGRVTPEDVLTMRTILAATVLQPFPMEYSILFTFVDHNTRKKLMDPTHFMKLWASVSDNDFSTNHMCFFPFIPELVGADNTLPTAPPGLMHFIHEAPAVFIPKEAVGKIEYGDWQERLAALKRENEVKVRRLEEHLMTYRERVKELQDGKRYDELALMFFGAMAGAALPICCEVWEGFIEVLYKAMHFAVVTIL
ncbi:hypothetical protein HDV00_006727 [Rhizophlyctis rosea]|nr:hypothetical protein HDV00_006727 [Rhizophlyctis rosea]